jgi:hypothetical protein
VTLDLEPVRIAAGADNEGQLVYFGGLLVAVLVRLSEEHGEAAGSWFLEAGFGRLEGPNTPVFSDLEQAKDWIARALSARKFRLVT